MRRAHLLRSIGGGLGGPLRSLPQESVARAKPALEPDHSTLDRANPHSSLASRRGSVPLSSAGLAGATNPGGRFGRGAKPPAEWNVQGVRLACGPRAPPCSWTLLIALARAFLRQARWSKGGAILSARRETGRKAPGKPPFCVARAIPAPGRAGAERAGIARARCSTGAQREELKSDEGQAGRIAEMAATRKSGTCLRTRTISGRKRISTNPAASMAACHCSGVRNPPRGR